MDVKEMEQCGKKNSKRQEETNVDQMEKKDVMKEG